MWAIRKKPQDLTTGQRTALAGIARDNEPLYRRELVKEQLRESLRVRGDHGKTLLAGVISWASRSRIPEFAKLAKTLRRFQPLIWNTLDAAAAAVADEPAPVGLGRAGGDGRSGRGRG
jgi:transposase